MPWLPPRIKNAKELQRPCLHWECEMASHDVTPQWKYDTAATSIIILKGTAVTRREPRMTAWTPDYKNEKGIEDWVKKSRNDKSDWNSWLGMHANLRQRMKKVMTWSGVAMRGEQEHGRQHHQGGGHQWGESHKLSHSRASFYLCLSPACTTGPGHLGHDRGGYGRYQMGDQYQPRWRYAEMGRYIDI